MTRILKRVLPALLVLWLLFLGVIFTAMKQDPESFAGLIAKLPMPAMLLFPFETFWSIARAGTLNIGDQATDFNLTTKDQSATVRLSTFRGKQPVILVFGSYT